MNDSHSIFQENLAAYALGALDSDEAAALEAHLQTCDTCPAELATYQRVGVRLLSALPPQAPGRGLKRTLEKRLANAAGPTRPQFKWSWSQAAIFGALVILIATNLFSIAQLYSFKQEQAELSREFYSEQTALAMLAYPGTQSIAFNDSNVTGSLLVDKKRNLLAVFAWRLPPAPEGETYQMWLIDPQGDRTSGGFLVPEDDQPFVMAVITSPQPLTGFVGLSVTLEPIGGSPKPTGQKVLHVDF
ncbi:MAG TPA: anti-sigma factor [Anaerolineales bacterium]|jgi:anti-sigma-K factor RskA|nr:anti-sigma factor [Anaerolineales bacterium]